MVSLKGRNHVNETARHGIVAHRLWEENLGNVTEVFVNDSLSLSKKTKTSGNKPKGIGNDDLGYVSQIFLPKTMDNDTMPCGFIYVIAPISC